MAQGNAWRPATNCVRAQGRTVRGSRLRLFFRVGQLAPKRNLPYAERCGADNPGFCCLNI